MHDPAKAPGTSTGEDHVLPGRKRAPENADNGWRLELLALGGFCVSGLFFIVAGLKSGDVLTVLGSVVWIASCLCWMLPYKKYLGAGKSSDESSLL
jgi:hypothetical protein